MDLMETMNASMKIVSSKPVARCLSCDGKGLASEMFECVNYVTNSGIKYSVWECRNCKNKLTSASP